MSLVSGIKLLDTTLREGEQTPGVIFSLAQKVKIAQMLDQMGINMLELGHPGISPEIDKAIEAISDLNLQAELILHCRAKKEDIEATAKFKRVQRVAVFLGTSHNHLQDKLRLTPQKAINIAIEAIKRAVDKGFKVRFTAEDAFRTDFDYLVEICGQAIEAGADRISLPDTVGLATPPQVKDVFTRFSAQLPKAKLDVHCHNDLGMAVANSLAAVEGGADCIHVTVNGIGERSGIAPLCNIAVALHTLFGVKTMELSSLTEISQLVEEFTGIPVAQNAPILGKNCFTHKSGVHAAGVLANASTYEAFSPDLIGRQRKISIDRYSGKSAVRHRLEQLGIELPDEDLKLVLQTIKSHCGLNEFQDHDLLELVKQTCKGEVS